MTRLSEIQFNFEDEFVLRTIRKNREQFHCVPDMYLYYLGRIETRGVRKLVISASGQYANTPIIENLLGVVLIEYYFPSRNFLCSKQEYLKKLYVLNCIHQAVQRIASTFDWSRKPFDKAYKKCIENGIAFKRFFDPTISSPDRKRKATLQLIHSIKDARIYLVVSESKIEKEIGRFLIARTRPHVIAYGRYVVRPKWLSPTRIAIVSKKKVFKRMVFDLDVGDGMKLIDRTGD